jgi:hypothetical protein
MILGAATTGWALRQLLPEVPPPSWTAALILAGLGAAAAGLVGLALRWIPADSGFALDPPPAHRLLRLGWGIAGAYALGWAAQTVFELPLILRAGLAAAGITVFLILNALIVLHMNGIGETDSLPAEMSLYFCWLNLALLVFWVESQGAVAAAVT